MNRISDQGYARYTRVTTVAAFLIFVLFFASILPLAILQSLHYRKLVCAFAELQTFLAGAAKTYDGTTTFAVTDLLPGLPFFTTISDEAKKTQIYSKCLYSIWVVWGALLWLVGDASLLQLGTQSRTDVLPRRLSPPSQAYIVA